jgi:hypothetical protein
MSDHHIIPPQPDIVRIIGRDIEVRALTVGPLLRIKQLFAGGKLESLPAGADLWALFDALPDEMIDMVAIATGLTREEIDRAEVDEFVILCNAVLEKNQDFFVQRLGPSLKPFLAQLVTLANLAGGFQPSRR